MAILPTASLLISIVGAGACGLIAVPTLMQQWSQAGNRLQLKSRVTKQEMDKQNLLRMLLRNGLPTLRPISQLLLGLRPVQGYCTNCERALRIKSYNTSANAILELLMVGSVVLALVVYLLTGLLLAALFAVVLVVTLSKGKATKILSKWQARLVEQIPDALRSLGICFSAGFSLQQAFEQTAKDTEAPLGGELMQTSCDINAGKSVEEALSELEKRTNAEDLSFAVVALEIQHRTGGSLQDLLENAADAVVASADLRRQLAVQTTQARLSAKVVTMLPLVLVAILSLAMDGYLTLFFSSVEGLTVLFVAIVMEVIGIFSIRKILGVDLD